MILKTNESRQESYTSGTYDGVYVNVLMKATANNTAILAADFNPALISMKASLKRNGRTADILGTNLLLNGTFATLKRGFHEFVNGIDKIYAASGVKAVKLRTVFIPFSGNIRLNKGDELIVELTCPDTGAFSSAIDTTNSSIQFYCRPQIGYELFTPSIKFEVVTSATPEQNFNLGNNVTKIAFMNFDQNTLANEVINQLSLTSDFYDLNANFNQVLAMNVQNFDEAPNARYGSVLPISATDNTGRALRGLDHLPQSFILFDGNKTMSELQGCRLALNLNGANVATSQNYIAYITYEATKEQVAAGINREQKHLGEKLNDTPAK